VRAIADEVTVDSARVTPDSDKENGRPKLNLKWRNKRVEQAQYFIKKAGQALREYIEEQNRKASCSNVATGTKRSSCDAELDDADNEETDSEIHLTDVPLTAKVDRKRASSKSKSSGKGATNKAIKATSSKATDKSATSDPKQTGTQSSKKAVADQPRATKKRRTSEALEGNEVDEHGDSDMSDTDANVNQGNSVNNRSSDNNGVILYIPELSRHERKLNPDNAEDAALIAAAPKAPATIYDSDAELDDTPVGRNIHDPHKFLNVKWGDEAYGIDDEDFEEKQTLPFTPFVPGRFERLPDGTARDQKYKLVQKFVNKDGERKIFRNPPPKDWNDQQAISALNKRIDQQIRRHTNYRARDVVRKYVDEERQWILRNINKDGKPRKEWKVFVNDFNKEFAGKTLPGHTDTRPKRTQSSLSKEVTRFSNAYKEGRIPALLPNAGKRKAKKDGNKDASTVSTPDVDESEAGSSGDIGHIDNGTAAAESTKSDQSDGVEAVSVSPKKRKRADAEPQASRTKKTKTV
jgi:hypothetical protein